jgi:metallo-beta-lactamase class B
LAFPTVADVELVSDREPVRLGALELTPWLTEGHTPGGTTWSWRSCSAGTCLDMVYADSQTPVSADDFHFTDSRAIPAFERGFQALESMSCDILVTPHPSASAFWERMEGVKPLIDGNACRLYAEAGRARLAQRLETESRTLTSGPDPDP